MQAEQHDVGQPYQELYEAVAGLKRRHDLHPCSVRPRDGLALRRDAEREEVQDLVARFRKLPAEQQRRLPALLNSLAQLEVVVGDLEAGQHDFQEVAGLVSDPLSQAEASHNVYRAALERRDWGEALAGLRKAVALDPEEFEPFPLGRYEPQRILGAGGFGVTFLCARRPGGGRVVVKALRADSLDRDVNVLFHEAAGLRDIDHPALVRVLECGGAGAEVQRPYLVLEYAEGVSLAEHVAQHGPFAPEDWLPVCWALARALQAAHGRGILHRSLRPACVLVRRVEAEDGGTRWRVKLLDTGLSLKRTLIHASASNPEARVQTALGRSVARTVAYAPAEVLGRPKGQVWVGPHSDVYSFGRLCAFALTGRPDPDGGDLVLLPEPWRKLLAECTGWTTNKRLAHFGLVLERLSQTPGASERVGQVERDLHEMTVAEHSAAIEADPTRPGPWVARGAAHARQGDNARAVADFSEAIRLAPEDASLYRRRGLAHARNGSLDAAIADYTEALRLEPRNVEALANRGLAYSQKGEHDRAIADYSEGLRQNPRDEVLFYNRGNAHYCKGEYDLAIADYDEAVRINPRNAWAFGNRGKAHALRGDQARAVADFTRVLQLDPANVKALADRAAAHTELGRHDRAVADYTEALRLEPGAGLYHARGVARGAGGDLEGALADFDEALALDPANLGARLARGNARCDLGQLEQALEDYAEAIRLAPESPAAYYNRGNVQARLGNHEQAIRDYTEAIRLDPGHGPAWFNRGNSHAERGDHDQAVADYTEALRLEPRDAAAYTNRGNAYAALGDTSQALADFSRALEVDPHDAVTLCNRAGVYARLDHPERALADYTEALRVDPTSARAYHGRGLVHVGRGELEQAIADFTRAIQLNPLARAYYHRGNAHAERGDLEQAIADYGEAVRLDPALAPAWFNRGIAHADRAEDEQAVADFSEVLRLEPGHAGAFNNRGNGRRRLGDLDGAFEDFSAAVAADPSFAPPYFNRANLRGDRGDLAGALADLTEAIRLTPDDASAYLNRGRIYTLLGEHERAIADNQEAATRAPDDPRVCNNLAWLWATCPRAELRDPARAVDYAHKACAATGYQDPGHLDTLAAACAAGGQFEEAVRWQRQAVELAPEEEKADYRSRLELYEAGRPYEQPAEAGEAAQQEPGEAAGDQSGV